MTEISSLTEKIILNAQSEAAEIILKAAKSAESRLQQQERRENRLIKEAENKAARIIREEKKKKKKLTRMYAHRIFLKNRERLIEKLIQEALSHIESLIDSPDYGRDLKNLALESVIGLDSSPAILLCSPEEMKYLTEEVIKEITEKAEQITGESVKVRLSPTERIEDRGVISRTEDGRIIYNNRIKARYNRKKAELLKIVDHFLNTQDNPYE